MTKQEFNEHVRRALPPTGPSLERHALEIADRLYDPALADDDARQLTFAARKFSEIAGGLYSLSDWLLLASRKSLVVK